MISRDAVTPGQGTERGLQSGSSWAELQFAHIAGGWQPLNWWECGKGGQGVSGFELITK